MLDNSESVNPGIARSIEIHRNRRAMVGEVKVLPMLAGDFKITRLEYIQRGRSPARVTFQHAGQEWGIDVEPATLFSFGAFREKTVECFGLLLRSPEFESVDGGAAWLEALSAAACHDNGPVDLLAGLPATPGKNAGGK